LKLSIGMIVKNEEKNLERCLSSLRPLMKAIPSELIIVDTGSTDSTATIARGYTDQVYFHPWENDYAKMRNFTVNYAQGAWFFFIDADEELVEYDAIVDFLSGENSRQYHAASVKINSLYKTGDARQFATASVTRLFRRTKTFRFEGAIHEQPMFDPPIFMLDAVLIHHGYVIDDPDLKERKLQLYEPILLKALEKNPLDVHFWYQLSRTYVSYKDARIALEPAVKAYEIIKKQKLKPSEYLYVYVNLAYLYLVNGSPLKAAEIAEEGLKVKEWIVDLWFYLEKAQAMLKKYEDAIRSCEKYLYYAEHYDRYLSQDIRMVSFTLSGKEEAHLDLSVLYKETGRNREAVEEFLKIESPEILNKAAAHGIALFAGMKDFGMLEGFYHKIKSFIR